ncbi:MAG: DUF1987 domain-containing protein [Gammaproteobacteria bacterium]|nr:DUF1987 domain-containing protein [Gammaproteobacteria bacterium]
MNDLMISAGKDTLGVSCDYSTGLIEMEGISYPEDAAEFFNPVFEWIDSYIEHVKGPIEMNLRISYLNTSSTKCLFDVIDRIEEYYKQNNSVQVNWYHEEDDEDIREIGLEFKDDMDLPFEVISY